MSDPQRNRAFTCTVSLIEAATGSFLASPPLAAGDFKVSKDGAAFANLTTLPVVAPAESICVQLTLSATEMDANRVVVYGVNVEAIWEPVLLEIQPTQTLGTDGRTLLSTDSQPTIPANVLALVGNSTSPLVLDQSARTMVRGVVAAGATLTSIPTSSLLPAAVAVDQFKGRVLAFPDTTLTVALRGQSADITGNTADGTLTISPLTTVPVVGDTLTII